MLNEKLSLCEDENLVLASQVFKMSDRLGVLESCNLTSEKDPSTSEGVKRKA